MYYIEPAGEADIRIMGIDPGTDTMGVAIVDVNIETNKPHLVFGMTIHASKELSEHEDAVEIVGSRDVRIDIIGGHIKQILVAACPTLVVAESPFYRPGRANAYEALVECFKKLREVVRYYSPTLTLRRIDPVTAKNYVGVSHVGDSKAAVEKAVIELYRCTETEAIFDQCFDEHTYDALAVTHAAYRMYYLREVVASSRKKKKKRRKKRGA